MKLFKTAASVDIPVSVKGYDIYAMAYAPLCMLIGSCTIYSFRGAATILYAIIFLSYLTFSKKHIRKDNLRKTTILFWFGIPLFVFVAGIFFHFSFPNRGVILGLFYGYMFITYDRIYQLKIFELFIKAFSVLLLISMIEYILVQIFNMGIKLTEVTRVETNLDNYTQYFNHYIFNIIKDDVFVRFQSLLEEPGEVGTMCGLMLFLVGNQKCYKKQFYIFVLAGALTLTMAFFFLFAIYLLSSVGFKKLGSLLFVLILFAIGIYIFYDTFENYTIKRFETGSVDDRSNDNFDAFLNKTIEQKDIYFWIGHGSGATNKMSIGKGVVGAKRELYDYGVLGILLFSLASFVSFKKYNGFFKMSIFYFLAFWASWYQRSDWFAPVSIMMFFNIFNVYYREKIIGCFSIEKSGV